MRSAYESKEKLISRLFIAGLWTTIAGLVIFIFSWVVLGVWAFVLGPILFVLGLIGLGAGLAIGIGHNRGMGVGRTRPQEEGRVVARFAINDIGEMIFDCFDLDAPDARYYVRIQFLDGRRDELECARPVFDQCGEGMRGLVTIQGNWLSQFSPLPDTPETRAAYRDW